MRIQDIKVTESMVRSSAWQEDVNFVFPKQWCFLDTATNAVSESFGIDFGLTMKNTAQILISEMAKDARVWAKISCFLRSLCYFEFGTCTYSPIHRKREPWDRVKWLLSWEHLCWPHILFHTHCLAWALGSFLPFNSSRKFCRNG